MRRKITLYLFALFAFFVTGTAFATFYIRNATGDLNRLITLHEIEDLRQDLIMSIQSTQSDLYTVYTPLGHELDSIVSNVTNLEHAAQKCTTCHHPPELFNRLKENQSLIEDYKTALSNYITASANRERIAMLKHDAAAIGGKLLTNTMEMSFQASNRLTLMTSSTMSQIGDVRKIIYATILLTFLLGIIVSIRLINFIARPTRELVNATREIAGGNLGYKLSYKDKTEFGEIASNFNAMSLTLKKSYEQLQGEIVERKQAEEQREKLEDQLLHAQKLESVGRLAGGVAHDFNNILTVIMGCADLLKTNINENYAEKIYLEQILAASSQAAKLTKSLLAFSRKQVIHPQPTNLNGIVTRIQKLLTRVIGEDIKLKTVLADEDATVMVDSGQMEQVLMNLATNARDAMPDGGLLSIETGVLEIDDEIMETHAHGKHGKYALISVTDSGIGMDEKTREKIFEPFFTTKEVGRGTGLGLSVVYGVIQQHNGFIDVHSDPGMGTRFEIYLPLIKSEVKEIGKTELSPVGGGIETVLVAEDDKAVRAFSRNILERFGYTVIEAEDGEKAIHRFMENKEKINLLLLDVIMPKKNGKAVYEEIKKIKPDIKVLFISGYPVDIIQKKGILEEGIEFIPKPVTINDLLSKVREVLDT